MLGEPLTMFCYSDLAGQIRGKGFPSQLIEQKLSRGMGWTPTNLMFTVMGTIADSPWQSFGDITLMPDPRTRVEVDFDDGTPAERFYLCDLRNTDSTPWECCPRTLLRDAAEALRAETGLILQASFEHEFIYAGAQAGAADMYALDAVRRHGAFGETFLGALAAAGVEIDSYLPEFAPGPVRSHHAPRARADRLRQRRHPARIARATAWRLGHTVTFSPRPAPEGLGSGVHIHFSLWTEDGRPSQPRSRRAQSASAHRRGPSLQGSSATCPRSAPSARPRRCPTFGWCRMPGPASGPTWGCATARPASASAPSSAPSPTRWPPQFNFEFRAADATANPYLQLATILRAGLEGIRGKLPTPTPTVERDPGEMSPEEREAMGIVRLPSSVDRSLRRPRPRRGRAGLPAARAAARLHGEQGRRDPADRRYGTRGSLRPLCADLLI